MHNKKPSVIEDNTENLLEALDKAGASVKSISDIKSEILPEHRGTYNFLRNNGIEKGEHRILKRYLYNLYLKESNEKKPATKETFNKVVGMIFNSSSSYIQINIPLHTLFDKLISKENRRMKKTVTHELRVCTYLNTLDIRSSTFFVKDKWLFNDYKQFYRNKKVNTKNLRFERFKEILDKYLKNTKMDVHFNTWYGVNETIYKRLNKQQDVADGKKKED